MPDRTFSPDHHRCPILRHSKTTGRAAGPERETDLEDSPALMRRSCCSDGAMDPRVTRIFSTRKGDADMKSFIGAVQRFWNDEQGAQGVEYAMLAGLIAVVFVVGAFALGTQLNIFFTGLSNCVANPSVENCTPNFGA
jgi:Flp pilus assembly pilin Flp